ncbi:hypothetical protein QH639_24760 [Lysinibacillus sp. 1 U-2021]|uniref:hypothetical protein n=1 Tax=Lysinibacillus sp. 1 U-2021 TaxID=3039426 RepID=UPI00247FFC96|nr:hypothetical protein [Lysinibacillus sp. 1 U-2021]WGT38954.1 hypothetical protein QH639_24760 [Lysinibacillus sp. 1 U-2021]
MKKGLQLSAAAVIALSAITPVATAAAAEPTAQQVKPGIYTTEGYTSIADFKKLTTAKKAALLQKPGAVLVVGTDVIPTEVILTGTNDDLENSKVSVEKYQEDNKVVITEDGIKPVTPEETVTVSAVSAITETTVSVTFAEGVEVTDEDLEGKTITLKAGETTLTATYASSSLAGSTAVFELTEESKLVDATEYTVTADWTKFDKTTFVAEIGTAYAKTFTAVTTKVYASSQGATETILNIKAQDQYGEAIDVPTTLDFDGSTLNGMPINTDLTVDTAGKVTLAKTVKAGDVLVLKVSNIDSEDKVLGTATFTYTVEKVEDGFNPLAPNSIESIKAIDANGATVTKFAATDVVTLSANVLDHASNPAVSAPGNDKEVRWVVKEGKNLLETTAVHTGTVGEELGSDLTTLDLEIGQTPTFKIKSPGTIVVEAYNIANGAKSSYTITAGAQELKTLTFTSKNNTGNNNEEVVLGKIEQNTGAAFAATDLKFRVLDSKGAETTKASVKAVVAAKNDTNGYAEGTIYLVATTTEAAAYTVVPYVGASFEDTKAVKAAPVAFETQLNSTAVSINAISLSTLKVGTPVTADLVIKNKHGENIVSELDLATDVEAVVYKDGAVAQGTPVTVTYEYDATTKNAKAKFVANTEGTYTVRLVVKNTAAVTDVAVKAEETAIASVNLGADIYDIVSGDKDVYRTITVKDNKGDVILPKIGAGEGELSLSQAVTNVSLEYVAKDAKGNWTVVAENKAEAVAVKFAKAIAKQEVTSVKVQVNPAPAGTVSIQDELKVTVKEARKLDKVTVSPASLTIGLNGETTITVNTVDQYGAAYTASASELTNLTIVDASTGSEKITVLTASGANATEVKDTNDKVIGYKFTVQGTAIGNTSLQVKSGADVKATINATVAEAVDVVSSIAFEGTSFNEDGTYKYKIDADENTDKFNKFAVTGKDASGNRVAIDPTKVTWTTSNASVLAYDASSGEFKVLKAVENDTVVTVTADLYGKKVSVDLTLSAETAKLVPSTLAVKESKTVDADTTKEGIQIALDGDNKDGEANGAITLTFTGKDQYGSDLTTLSDVLAFKESVAKVSKNGNKLTITAVGKGDTQVRTTVDGTDFLIDVTVTDKAVADAGNASSLADAQTQAKAALDAYVDVTDYTTNEQALTDAIAAGKVAIDAATTTGDVATALANAKTVIDGIKTDTQLALIDAQTQAKAALDAYVNAADYTTNEQALTNAIAAGKVAIDAATTTGDVATALADAKTVIDDIDSDTEEVATIKASLSSLAWDTDEATTLSAVKAAISGISEASVEEDVDDQVVITITIGNASDTITLTP